MRASAEPSAPAALRTAFERLEYGKLCLSPEGPIEKGVEAYPLVRSAGFPRALEPLCHPAIVGVGGSDLPAGMTEGWVLRGVLHPGGLAPIACRLRLRPEDGEGGVHRRYWLGRYLCCPEGPADPFTFFLALRDQPLRGVTAAELRNAWLPIAVEDDRSTAVDPLLHAFLRQAIVYAISAVPIGLSPSITPERFFRWASSLWSLLPPELRPAFAAGWGVAPSTASALNLSFALGYSTDVAVFDLGKCLWRGPAERMVLIGRSEEQSLPWQDCELTPGRMYLRESFPWNEGEPELDFLAPGLDHLTDLDLGTAYADFPEVVDLRSPWARDLFILPGLCSLDYARSHLLQSWLADPAMSEPQSLCISAADYFTPTARRRVLQMALRSLSGDMPDLRGTRVLWSSLRDAPGLLDEVEALGGEHGTPARAHLLLALARGDAEASLKVFAEVPGVEAGLPPEAARRIEEFLGASLETGIALSPHREILRRSELPELYRGWVARHSRWLALGLASGADSKPALGALAQFTADPFVETIARWQQGMAPAEKDARALEEAGDELREAFGWRFLAVWNESRGGTIEWRERFLPWVGLLFPSGLPRGSDPLLRIQLEGADLDLGSGEGRSLSEAIGAGSVPPSLQSQVAALVLRYWDFFAREYQGAGRGWTEILNLWPYDVRAALLGTSAAGKKEVDGAPPEVRRAAETLSLSCRRLRDLLAVRRGSPQVAQLLWLWCLNALDEDRILAPGICRDLARGHLPSEKVFLEEIRLAADLAEQVDFFSNEPTLLARLWEQAQSASQTLLLLACAPGVDLRPSLAQLEALIPWREALQKHLAARNIHEGRKRLFEIATFEFHGVDRSKDSPRGDYRDSVLWAAFRRIPFEMQGDLERAFEIYAEGENGHLFNQRRVQLANRYLEQYRKPEEFSQAVRLVARALVLPLAVQSGVGKRKLIKILRRMFEERSRGNKNATLPESGDPSHAFRVWDNGDLLIARWFKSFLLQIRHWGGGEALLAELER